MKKNHLNFLYIFLIIAMGVGIYANSLQGEFHFDDYTYIVNKNTIRDITNIEAIKSSLTRTSRFVSFYTFALNYHFHEYREFGYHLVNMIIHIFNALLVYWFIFLILKTPVVQRREAIENPQLIAFLGGMLFLVHPIQAEAVSYVVQRFTSLATFFYLLALCFYLVARLKNRIIYFVYACLFAFVGMFTKEITFTIPLIILMCEVFFLNETKQPFHFLKLKRFWGIFAFILIVPGFFQFDAAHILLREVPSRSHPGEMINGFQYLLTQFRVLIVYLRLWIFPYNQTLDYDFAPSLSLMDVAAMSGFVILLALFIFAIWLFKRSRLLSFSLLWFFITITVTSSFIPIPQVIFEHRMYLPSIGLSLFTVLILYQCLRRQLRLLQIAALIFVTLGYVTYERNKVWQSEINLWEDIVKKAPTKARGYNNLGMAYLLEKNFDKAIASFNHVLELDPWAARAYNNRGLAHLYLKREDLAFKDFSKGITLLENSTQVHLDTVAMSRKWAVMYNNRGNIYLRRQEYQRALNDYTRAIEIFPRGANFHYNKGYVHERLQQDKLAFTHYSKAIDYDSRYMKAYVGRGFLYQVKREHAKAVADFDQALHLNAQYSTSYFYRSLSLFELGEHQKAREDMKKALKLGFLVQHPNLIQIRDKILGRVSS